MLEGRSGSGKSTLCQLIAGLEPPDHGRVLVGGTAAVSVRDWARLALLPQRLGLPGELSVAENVNLPRWVRGLPERAELLDAFDLVHLAGNLTGQASRGEQQRVAIARAAALGPAVIVLDEPTSHQDEAHADLVAAPAARAGAGRQRGARRDPRPATGGRGGPGRAPARRATPPPLRSDVPARRGDDPRDAAPGQRLLHPATLRPRGHPAPGRRPRWRRRRVPGGRGRGRPGVLFFIEWLGLRPRIADMVEPDRRLGLHGARTRCLLPRRGPPSTSRREGTLRDPEERERFMATGPFERVRRYTPDLSGPDTGAWVDALATHARPGRIGTTGYCMGARLRRCAPPACYPNYVVAVSRWRGGRARHRRTRQSAPRHRVIRGHLRVRSRRPRPLDARRMPSSLARERRWTLPAAPHLNKVYPGSRARLHDGRHRILKDETAAEHHSRELRRLPWDDTLRG